MVWAHSAGPVLAVLVLLQGASAHECQCGPVAGDRATQVPLPQDHKETRRFSSWPAAVISDLYDSSEGGKYRRRLASPELQTENSPRDPQCPSQVHIALGGPGKMTVSWVVRSAAAQGNVVYGPADSDSFIHETHSDGGSVYSNVMTVRSGTYTSWLGSPSFNKSDVTDFVGTDTELGQSVHSARSKASGDPYFTSNFYDSPVIHTAVLSGLRDGQAYKYKLPGDCEGRAFRMPPNHFPLTFGLTADLGQTEVSTKSLQELEKLNPAAVLLAGDLSYADGFGPRWDRFGELAESLGQRFPIMSCPGNHEVHDGEQFVAYNARFPMPFRSSGSMSNAFWSADIGPVHVISLNTYTRQSIESYQYKWLLHDLSEVDRRRTPWLVAIMHGPWYSTNRDHRIRGEPVTLDMRTLMEPLFNKHGVDFVITGHVHAYERTFPVSAGRRDPCGPVYLSLGDAGNYEGSAAEWGHAEDWSAFRESTFGIGHMDFHNETHAFFEWGKLACENDSKEYSISFNPTCSTTRAAADSVSGDGVTRSDRAVLMSWQARCPHAFARRPWTTGLFEATDMPAQNTDTTKASLDSAESVGGLHEGLGLVRDAVGHSRWLDAAGFVALAVMGGHIISLRRRLRNMELRDETCVELFPYGAE